MNFRERLRAFEQELELRMSEFQCSVHLCLGQEEVPAVLHEELRTDDWLFSTHRSHGHYLAKGGTEQKLLDEILGLPTGVNGGYSGSQSFCDPSIHFHSTAIVGGLIGVATGTALALKLQSSSARVICCIGEAATEQGVFWEAMNFASLHALPILFICENNRLSVHAPLKLRQCAPLVKRVEAFKILWYRGAAYIRAALGNLPSFVEVDCVREGRHVSAMEDLRE